MTKQHKISKNTSAKTLRIRKQNFSFCITGSERAAVHEANWFCAASHSSRESAHRLTELLKAAAPQRRHRIVTATEKLSLKEHLRDRARIKYFGHRGLNRVHFLLRQLVNFDDLEGSASDRLERLLCLAAEWAESL